MWIFVLGDLAIFTLFFSTFLFYRSQAIAEYALAQVSLNLATGAINTVILLTSSWLLALAVKAARAGRALSGRWALLVSIGLGVAFIAGKITEYIQIAGEGIGPAEAEFFMFYFVFTGIHLLHVTVGLIALAIIAKGFRTETLDQSRLRILECGGIYWHMVDILWIILFTLFYLIA